MSGHGAAVVTSDAGGDAVGHLGDLTDVIAALVQIVAPHRGRDGLVGDAVQRAGAEFRGGLLGAVVLAAPRQPRLRRAVPAEVFFGSGCLSPLQTRNGYMIIEDVTQEVLLTMHRVRHTCDPGRPLPGAG